MADVIAAFARGVEAERGGHELADLVESARTRGAHEGFQFGKREFDRIEVRTVRREKAQRRSGPCERGPNLGLFVHGEVIEDNDIPGPERRYEDLLDIGEETHVIDRSVEDGRRTEPLEPQPGHDCVRFPMTTGRVIPHADAAQAATVAPEQIGRHATFIEEYVLPHIAQRLPDLPLSPGRRDIRPALLVGVYRFF